jgi:excisionase family DNA binding protein
VIARDLHNLLSQLPAPEQLAGEDIPPLVARLAAFQNALMARWAMLRAEDRKRGGQAHDTLLTVEAAAARLSVSVDYVYRNASKLPFTVREGRLLRFSGQGVDDYIRRKRSGY